MSKQLEKGKTVRRLLNESAGYRAVPGGGAVAVFSGHLQISAMMQRSQAGLVALQM
jgi:hypothetical protein